MLEIRRMNDRAEWLDARRNTIGGSEASAIIGLNPYMNNVELWEIKTGRREQEDIGDKPYVRYGTEAEKHLRELFALDFPEYEVIYDNDHVIVNDDYPWAHASLDGRLIEKETGRLGILEIKTTEILSSMHREKWSDRVPDNYYVQVLHYLMVTGYDFAILKAQLKSTYNGETYLQTRHYRFERSNNMLDIAFLAEKEEEFCKSIQLDTRPALVLPEI